VADLVVRFLLECRLGDPVLTRRTAGALRWHNGATRDASLFAEAMDDGRWVVVHRLGGASSRTDRAGIEVLRRGRP
jgi:hypothetical protein